MTIINDQLLFSIDGKLLEILRIINNNIKRYNIFSSQSQFLNTEYATKC